MAEVNEDTLSALEAKHPTQLPIYPLHHHFLNILLSPYMQHQRWYMYLLLSILSQLALLESLPLFFHLCLPLFHMFLMIVHLSLFDRYFLELG